MPSPWRYTTTASRITVFVGPNGTGKPSVLQAIALLKQSIGSNGLRIDGELLKLAGPSDIVPKFVDAPATARIVLTGAAERANLIPLGFGNNVGYSCGAKFQGTGLVSHAGQLTFEFDGTLSKLVVSDSRHSGEFPKSLEINSIIAQLQPAGGLAAVAGIGGWQQSPTPQLQSGLSQILKTPNYVLRTTRFVFAARGLVQPRYSLGPQLVDNVSLVGGLGAQENTTATNLAYGRHLEVRLSGWLKQVT